MPTQRARSSKRNLRAFGLALGLVIGGGFGTLAELVDFGALVNLENLPWSLSTVLTGALVGWLFGPTPPRTEGARRWIWLAVKQAVASVVIGSFMVATLGTLQLTVVRTGDLGSVPVAVYAGTAYGLLGIVFLGWLIAPIAFAAAGLWNVAMVWTVRLR